MYFERPFNKIVYCRSGTAEEVNDKKELLWEISDLMEAAIEILEEKRKECQQKNKDA